jgi:hypothetical protein
MALELGPKRTHLFQNVAAQGREATRAPCPRVPAFAGLTGGTEVGDIVLVAARSAIAWSEGLSPWEQQTGESPQAYGAFRIYRDLGRGRSLREAYRRWRGAQAAAPISRRGLAPSGAWKRWRRRWRWEARAELFDRRTDRAQLAAAAELRRQERAREERRFALLWRGNELIDWLLEQPISSAFTTYSSFSREKRQTVRGEKVLIKLTRFARLYEKRYFRGFTVFSGEHTGG